MPPFRRALRGRSAPSSIISGCLLTVYERAQSGVVQFYAKIYEAADFPSFFMYPLNGRRLPFQGMMLKVFTSRFRAKNMLPLLASAVFFLAAPQAFADSVPVTLGAHPGYTRVVFTFPKLVAYKAAQTANGLVLTFDTPMTADIPGKMAGTVAGITATQPDAATLKVLVRTASPAQFKDFRLLRKVVVDVLPQDKPVAAVATPAPVAKPVEEKAAVAPPPAVVPKPAPPVTMPVPVVAKKDIAPPPAAAPVSPVAAEEIAIPDTPTKITLSAMEPVKLAVFSRFGTLWIVTDSTGGGFTPTMDGPLQGMLGAPKFFKFEQGSAWRYTMPPKANIVVKRRDLAWDISIHPHPQGRISPTETYVEFDNASGKGKLMAQLRGAGAVMSFEDPASGDLLYVVPTAQENARVSTPRRLADLEILPAEMGYVLRPLRDDLKVNRVGDYVLAATPGGITATQGAVGSVEAMEDAEDDGTRRIFDFPNWRQGGLKQLNKNRHAIEDALATAKTPEDRQSLLMRLAFLYFANNFGQETLGVLRMIEAENEGNLKNPSYLALKGAASAMAGQYSDAIRYLSDPIIQQHPEVSLWSGYASAASEQWRAANRAFPKTNALLLKYPDNIAIPITLYMAESALRLGQTDSANALLDSVDSASEDFSNQFSAAIRYLRGEAFRQQGDNASAERLWGPVAEGIDRLYHTKASLALTNLQLQEKKITAKDAIDKLDSLRFAWRGDGLEVQILQNLGELKAQSGQFLSGLEDLKYAAGLADTMQDDSGPIRDSIQRILSDLFLGERVQKISPLEAISVYTEFGALLPEGAAKAEASLHFADYLVRMDLLDKAAKIFDDALKTGSVPEDRVSAIGARLAAVDIIDGRPADAIAALDSTERASDTDAKRREDRALLRARALSRLQKTEDAIIILSAINSPDAKKLKADILWRAQSWNAAAVAMAGLLPETLPETLDAETAQIILNMAVARKLGGDAAELDALAQRYGAAMKGSPLASAFNVVTREGGLVTLSDRETILKMAGEVDMFKGFLDTYKSKSEAGG
jgi:tetratricopeptide (TPR) repeat protein